jgi:alpha-glucosidase
MAMAVVYYSPLTFLYWYDEPDKYAGGDWPDLAFLDRCPTTWDETRAISGTIGEHVVVARRRGACWFLGAMTNEAARTLEIPMSFLGQGQWTATIFADGATAEKPWQTRVSIGRQHLSSRDTLQLKLAPSGGQAIIFETAGKAEPADPSNQPINCSARR